MKEMQEEDKMDPEVQAEPSTERLRRFALEVAGTTKDGEDDGSGGEFVLENDDAVDTVHALVSEAREMFGLPFRNDPPEEED
jgi:hypothetical protein